MTRIGTLWGDVRQRQSKVIISVANLNGFELDQPQWSWGKRPAEFTAKFTYGMIPAFEGADGFKLIEGGTIARYLSSIGTVSLLGSTAKEAAIVDQWMHFAEHEIAAPADKIMGTVYGYLNTFNREILDKNHKDILRALQYLESHLATQPSGFVALDMPTLADFFVAGAIASAASITLGSAERTQYPHVFAYYNKVTADEKVKAYWGTDKFVDVRITEPRPMPASV